MGMVTLNSIYKYPKKLLNTTRSKLHGTEYHVINYQEAGFSKIKHSFGISLK